MEITLGWLGMIIGLLGFSAFWGWLFYSIGEDMDERKKKADKDVLDSPKTVDYDKINEP